MGSAGSRNFRPGRRPGPGPGGHQPGLRRRRQQRRRVQQRLRGAVQPWRRPGGAQRPFGTVRLDHRQLRFRPGPDHRPADASLAPGQYFLVELAAGSNTTLPALPTPDLVGETNASGTGGKFALVTGTTGLGCSNNCDAGQLARIVDLLGWGSANFWEGDARAGATQNSTAAIRREAGCQDTDQNADDFVIATPAPRNSQSPLNPCGGDPGNPVVSINDVTLPEGDAGVTPFEFTVTLFPALADDLSFDIATADGTAVAGTDYVARSLSDQLIPAGETSYSFSVDVIGNLEPEPDKTFLVNLTNVSAGTIALEDVQAVGTIVNDDFDLTPISAIQGEGISSPLLGQQVATRGIVTARKSNGFFIQTPDGEDDGNPATSEGLFIFTTAGGCPRWRSRATACRCSAPWRSSSRAAPRSSFRWSSSPAPRRRCWKPGWRCRYRSS
ncbi:Calx-beta domain-containing protein [Alkalisalibacterium limincola]|uniref:Calx-beta domain-containing protein n=1 Tax=Alkalisalibacterium limincola TaxID=2699169 RepID=UPI00210462D5|nr:Calx-beta domain-containing protein [Alkalisalibacterium limincola]